MIDSIQVNLYHYAQNDTVLFLILSGTVTTFYMYHCVGKQTDQSLFDYWFFCCRPRPGRSHMFEAKAEAEDDALRPRPRPRPKFWPRGHFGLEDNISAGYPCTVYSN